MDTLGELDALENVPLGPTALAACAYWRDSIRFRLAVMHRHLRDARRALADLIAAHDRGDWPAPVQARLSARLEDLHATVLSLLTQAKTQ